MKDVRVEMQVRPLEYHACEAINMLRGAVQMAGAGTRVFAVTSALAHEGKSSLAFRLAQSLAALEGKRVVFVDCDIRNSRVKKRYRITQRTLGLSDYLCGNASYGEIVYPTQNPQLELIFCGRRAPNPSELVSGSLMDELLDQLKQEYDYVVVERGLSRIILICVYSHFHRNRKGRRTEYPVRRPMCYAGSTMLLHKALSPSLKRNRRNKAAHRLSVYLRFDIPAIAAESQPRYPSSGGYRP